jgi:maltose O-acetyltransferase
MMLEACGKDVNIEHGADFGKGRDIRLGDRSGIGIRARLDDPVLIGNDVMMGPDVLIFTQGHRFSDLTKPMIEQGSSKRRPVVIGNDVWIGERAIILPGVTVGDGAIIGAGAVVRDSIPPLGIAIGNPAVVVDTRRNLKPPESQ